MLKKLLFHIFIYAVAFIAYEAWQTVPGMVGSREKGFRPLLEYWNKSDSRRYFKGTKNRPIPFPGNQITPRLL